MAVAYDFSEVPGPSVAALVQSDAAGVLIYGTGPQQTPEYEASISAGGLKLARIWEHNTDSILGGFDYGASEARLWLEAHPEPCVVYLACDLNDGALAGRSIVPFVEGWLSVDHTNIVGVYGPDLAIMQAQGIAGVRRFWGVVNWLTGGYADNDPRNIEMWRSLGAHLVQLIGSPIAGADQNLILADNWASLEGAPYQGDSDMDSVVIIGLDKLPISYAVAGSTILFQDDPAGARGAFGIPQAALDRGHVERLDDKPSIDGQGTAFDRLKRASDASLLTPALPPVTASPTVDVAALAAALQTHLSLGIDANALVAALTPAVRAAMKAAFAAAAAAE